jgi:hypothetical protein
MAGGASANFAAAQRIENLESDEKLQPISLLGGVALNVRSQVAAFPK